MTSNVRRRAMRVSDSVMDFIAELLVYGPAILFGFILATVFIR